MILYGRSLGTGIASYVASKNNPRMIILETPYFNFTSLVQAHVPVFPAGPSLKYKFRTNRYLQDLDCPIYMFHGTEDIVVPYKQGRRLYEYLGPEKASLFVVEGGSHNNLDEFEEYWTQMREILFSSHKLQV